VLQQKAHSFHVIKEIMCKNLFYTINIIFIVLIINTIGCSNDPEGPQNSDHFEGLSEVITIDNQTNINKGYPIIPAVSHATSDLNNNIYVADPQYQTLHSFSENMKFRWTVGRRGTGPGEYNRITSLFTTNNFLYVVDGPAAIVNTYLLTTGEHIDGISLGEAGHIIQTINQNESNEYVTTGFNADDQTVVNIYSENFSERIDQLVPVASIEFSDNQNITMQFVRNFPGNAFPIGDSLIVYTTQNYNGNLSLYKHSKNSGWSLNSTIEGYKIIEESYLIQFTDNGDNKRSHLSGFNPDGGYFHLEFKSISFGLFPQTENSFVHVSPEDTWDLIIESFDQSNLSLTRHLIIKEFIKDIKPQKLPVWMSSRGELFITENSDTPLRIYQIPSYIGMTD
jgi:hypothetical protein